MNILAAEVAAHHHRTDDTIGHLVWIGDTGMFASSRMTDKIGIEANEYYNTWGYGS